MIKKEEKPEDNYLGVILDQIRTFQREVKNILRKWLAGSKREQHN